MLGKVSGFGFNYEKLLAVVVLVSWIGWRLGIVDHLILILVWLHIN